MGKKLSLHDKGISLFMYLAICGMALAGCATSSTQQTAAGESGVPVIESVGVQPSQEQTVVEVRSSSPAPYASFMLPDPLRVVLDIRGEQGAQLRRTTDVNAGGVKDVRFEEGKAQAITTRLVVALSAPAQYDVKAVDNVIRLTIRPERAARETPVSPEPKAVEAAATPASPSEPRIFFHERSTKLTQILGIDFTMLDHGKSRLIVTTDKKGRYELDRKGQNAVILKIPEATIPPQLLRAIDSSQFAAAVDQIQPAFSSAKKQVSITLSLKEMVPFHVQQKDNTITVDFGPTSIKPSEKKIVPLQFAQAQVPAPEPGRPPAVAGAPAEPAQVPGMPKTYSGTPMTMDFVNADVTNILRLIGEVSNMNVIWGPEVRGTVSMRLKNIPWDQALDLVLTNNGLGMRREGNLIWVTTKKQLAEIEADERIKKEERQREIDEKLKREKALEKEEESRTAYLTVNYKDVENIKKIIEGTVMSKDTGRITVDSQTKTIILYDKISKIEEAKELKNRLDLATPQVMIEARIIEATSSFSRNLGVAWEMARQTRSNSAMTWSGTPKWAVGNVEASYPSGSKLVSPSFGTNFSTAVFPRGNFGLSFANLSAAGLTGMSIDAALALSEAEGKSKTLSSPKIVTRDTVEAMIKQGTTLPFPSAIGQSGEVTYEKVPAALILTVKPQITPNNMVIMDVRVQDDFPDYANRSGVAVPIKTKEAKTQMMVRSGETVVIGGIYKEELGDRTEGIPGLSKIPLLGWLFKANAKNDTKVELLIFLTPTVLPSV